MEKLCAESNTFLTSWTCGGGGLSLWNEKSLKELTVFIMLMYP